MQKSKKPQNLTSKHDLIIGTYSQNGQNLEKRKKDKIATLSFLWFLTNLSGFYHFNVPEEIRISEILFATMLTKILTDNRKGVFYLYQKRKR